VFWASDHSIAEPGCVCEGGGAVDAVLFGERGLQSVEMLLDRVLGKIKGGPKEKTLPSKLILRESTGHAPQL
jgi:hypothetical protein